MKQVSEEEKQGLEAISKEGRIMIGAMDHRQSLKKLLVVGLSEAPRRSGASHRARYARDDKPALNSLASLSSEEGREEIVEVKRLLLKHLGPLCSGVLLDPEYGRNLSSEVPEGVGLLLSLEKSGYSENEVGERKTELLVGFGAKEAKQAGAKAVKLLLYYHPEAGSSERQRDLVARVREECLAEEMLFLLEPIVYSLKEGDEIRRAELTLMTAEALAGTADVLKLESPVDPQREPSQQEWLYWCRQISERVEVPWVLLSRGMEYELYKEVLTVACRGGARGFAVGRAVWQEIGKIAREADLDKRMKELERFLATEGRARLAELVAIVEREVG